MKSKILIPVMAFVFAIAMSFTTEKSAATVWADMGGIPVEVNAADCGSGNAECVGRFQGDNTEYHLFHDDQLKNPILGSTTNAVEIEYID